MQPTPQPRQLRWLVGFLAASYGAALLGSRFTFPSLSPWYRRLRKPSWTPPNQIFGPVWTTLYTLMGVAAWLVQRQTSAQSAGRPALTAWWLQLVLNVAWSAVFFGRRNPAAGVLTIATLWTTIVATIALSWRVSRSAALLLLPYLAWTTFAGALNARIWQLNRR